MGEMRIKTLDQILATGIRPREVIFQDGARFLPALEGKECDICKINHDVTGDREYDYQATFKTEDGAFIVPVKKEWIETTPGCECSRQTDSFDSEMQADKIIVKENALFSTRYVGIDSPFYNYHESWLENIKLIA